MHFSEQSDPFFLSCQRPTEHDDTVVQEIKPSLLSRVRASELIILEEALFNVNY